MTPTPALPTLGKSFYHACQIRRVLAGVVVVFGVLSALVLPGSRVQAETLYNGIQLPDTWPPAPVLPGREPQSVPYLANPPAVIPINIGRQLFVDDFLVGTTTMVRTFHRAVPYEGNPVVTPDRSWEGTGISGMAMPFSDGVWYDSRDRLFKMWYMAGVPAGVVFPEHKGAMMTCYAISKDGLNWEKPDCGIVPGTNIVLTAPRDSAVVVLDSRPDTDKAKRFAMLRVHRPSNDVPWEYFIHYSSDGIHWSDQVVSKASKLFGDRTTAFFNPFRNVWVHNVRNSVRNDPDFVMVRVRNYHEHADFAEGLLAWERHPWLGADRYDPRHPEFPEFQPQLYSFDAVAYESLMVGYFSILEGIENDALARLNIHKRNEILLGFSRDGYHWSRPDRRPFIGVNPVEGAWNWGNVQGVGGGCIVVGDRLYIYYSGRQWTKAGGRGPSSTGVAFLRRDGFASMSAGSEGGTLTTRPVVFEGQYLFANLDTGGGELRVAVLDENGAVIPGYSASDCVVARGDSTRHMIRWKSATDLSSLKGKPVMFRFELTRGDLYSFWVSADTSGESGGFPGSGDAGTPAKQSR